MGIKISELTSGNSVNGDDRYPAVQSGSTKKFSPSQMASYILNTFSSLSLGGVVRTVKAAIDSIAATVASHTTLLGDTSMGTTATTVTGAIAEHETDITTLNSNTNYSSQYTNSLSTSPDSVSIIRKGNIAHVVILYPSVSFSADTAVGVLPPDIKASALTIFKVVNRTSGAPMSGTVWLSANQNNIRYYGTAFSNTRVAIEGVVSLDI